MHNSEHINQIYIQYLWYEDTQVLYTVRAVHPMNQKTVHAESKRVYQFNSSNSYSEKNAPLVNYNLKM